MWFKWLILNIYRSFEYTLVHYFRNHLVLFLIFILNVELFKHQCQWLLLICSFRRFFQSLFNFLSSPLYQLTCFLTLNLSFNIFIETDPVSNLKQIAFLIVIKDRLPRYHIGFSYRVRVIFSRLFFIRDNIVKCTESSKLPLTLIVIRFVHQSLNKSISFNSILF